MILYTALAPIWRVSETLIFDLNHPYSEIYKNLLKIWSAWCYSDQSGHPNFSSEWCYSGQNVGVIKPQYVGVIVSSLYLYEIKALFHLKYNKTICRNRVFVILNILALFFANRMVSGVFFLTGITFTFLLPVVKNIDMSRNFFLGAMQVRLEIFKTFLSLNLG